MEPGLELDRIVGDGDAIGGERRQHKELRVVGKEVVDSGFEVVVDKEVADNGFEEDVGKSVVDNGIEEDAVVEDVVEVVEMHRDPF